MQFLLKGSHLKTETMHNLMFSVDCGNDMMGNYEELTTNNDWPSGHNY